jgi:hypothetical protein
MFMRATPLTSNHCGNDGYTQGMGDGVTQEMAGKMTQATAATLAPTLAATLADGKKVSQMTASYTVEEDKDAMLRLD